MSLLSVTEAEPQPDLTGIDQDEALILMRATAHLARKEPDLAQKTPDLLHLIEDAHLLREMLGYKDLAFDMPPNSPVTQQAIAMGLFKQPLTRGGLRLKRYDAEEAREIEIKETVIDYVEGIQLIEEVSGQPKALDEAYTPLVVMALNRYGRDKPVEGAAAEALYVANKHHLPVTLSLAA